MVCSLPRRVAHRYRQRYRTPSTEGDLKPDQPSDPECLAVGVGVLAISRVREGLSCSARRTPEGELVQLVQCIALPKRRANAHTDSQWCIALMMHLVALMH